MKEKVLAVIRKIPFNALVGLFWVGIVGFVAIVSEVAIYLDLRFSGETPWLLVFPLMGLLFASSWVTVDMCKDYYKPKKEEE